MTKTGTFFQTFKSTLKSVLKVCGKIKFSSILPFIPLLRKHWKTFTITSIIITAISTDPIVYTIIGANMQDASPGPKIIQNKQLSQDPAFARRLRLAKIQINLNFYIG